MKNIAITIFALSMMACGGGKDEKKNDDVNTESRSADYQKGLDLVAKNNCMSCHKIEDQFTGPAYREVAKRYAGESDTIVSHLAKKIINGSQGVWGEAFMIAHPNVSQTDAETMVKYILSLNK